MPMPVAQYRKKPITISAIQLTPHSVEQVEAFVGGDATCIDGQLVIATLEGKMRANVGDWIIRGIKGEFYPCKPDIFSETYEPA